VNPVEIIQFPKKCKICDQPVKWLTNSRGQTCYTCVPCENKEKP
jgi:hypothetical protein